MADQADKMKKYIQTNLIRLEKALPYSLTTVTTHLLARESITEGEKDRIDQTTDRTEKTFTLFQILKKNYPTNYKTLIEILNDDGCAAPEAVRILNEFYSSGASSTSNINTSERENLRHQRLSDPSIHKVSLKLSQNEIANQNARIICNNLGLKFDLLFPNNPLTDMYAIFYKILINWREGKPDEANLTKLQAVLKSLNLNDIANYIADCV